MKEGERGKISVAVGNIPAPGLGKLGAMQIRCYAETSVEYNLRIRVHSTKKRRTERGSR